MSLPSARRATSRSASSNETMRMKPFLAFQEQPSPITMSHAFTSTDTMQDQLASINAYHAKEIRAKQRMIDTLKAERDKAQNTQSDHYRNRRLNILDRELTESRTVFNTLIEYIERRGLMNGAELSTLIDSIQASSNVVNPVNQPKLQYELNKAKQRADELAILVEKYKRESVKRSSNNASNTQPNTASSHYGPDEKSERMKQSLPKLVIGSSNDVAHQQSINSLHSTIVTLNDQIAHFHTQLTDRDTQIDQLHNELLNMQSNLLEQSQAFDQSFKQLHQVHSAAINSIHDQQSINHIVDQEYFCQEVRQFKLRMESIIQSKSELEHQLSVARSNESRLLSHVASMHVTINQLKQTDSISKSIDLKRIISEQSMTVGVLTANSAAGGDWLLQSCQQRINELELIVVDHQQRDSHYQNDRQLFNKTNQKLAQTLNEMKCKEESIESLSLTISQLQSQLTESKQSVTVHESIIAEKNAEIERLQSQNKDLILQLAQHQAAILSVDDERREIDAEREELRCEREEQVLREKEVLLSNRAAKQAQITAENKQIELQKIADQANLRRAAIEAENGVLIQTISQLNQSIATKQQQADLLVEKQLRQLEQQIEKRIRDELTAEFEHDESVLRDKEELIRLLQRENFDLEGRISSQSRKIVDLADQVEQLEQDLAARPKVSVKQLVQETQPSRHLTPLQSPSQAPAAAQVAPTTSEHSTEHRTEHTSGDQPNGPESVRSPAAVAVNSVPTSTPRQNGSAQFPPSPSTVGIAANSVSASSAVSTRATPRTAAESAVMESPVLGVGADPPSSTHADRPAQHRFSVLDAPFGVPMDSAEIERARFFSSDMQLSPSGYRPEHSQQAELPPNLVISAPLSPFSSAPDEASNDKRQSVYPDDRKKFVELALAADAALDLELQVPDFVLPVMSA